MIMQLRNLDRKTAGELRATGRRAAAIREGLT
jgi:hypothetical protein